MNLNQFQIVWVLPLLLSFFSTDLTAQFSLDGQMVQRYEHRAGYGDLLAENDSPANFIGQRARLRTRYQLEKFHFHLSIQDIRIWGSTPQVKLTDNFLSVHEAWASYHFTENIFIRMGRQELNYDNFRFLGNLDWALQGRAHDLALAAFEKESLKLHLGLAYNQASQSFSQIPYNISNQYRTAQFLRLEENWSDLYFSILFWNEGRVIENNLEDEEIAYRQTFGIPTLRYSLGGFQWGAHLYFQTGKDRFENSVRAHCMNVQLSRLWPSESDEGRSAKWTIGFEWLSGTDFRKTDKNHSFNPAYGTNHLFNGYMDLFYVGPAWDGRFGLRDIYSRFRYTFNEQFFVQADGHLFYSDQTVNPQNVDPPPDVGKYLGSEIDLSAGLLVKDYFSIQAGLSFFMQSDGFELIYEGTELKDLQMWGYLMLIFRPEMPNKFIGILN